MFDRRRGIYYLHKMASTLSGELGKGTLLRIKKRRGAEEGPSYVKRLKAKRLHDDLAQSIFSFFPFFFFLTHVERCRCKSGNERIGRRRRNNVGSCMREIDR